MTAASRITVPTGVSDGAPWFGHLRLLLEQEVRMAAADGLLTTAEADLLLARLVLVIDQAMTPARP